jgi:hypothetical protein
MAIDKNYAMTILPISRIEIVSSLGQLRNLLCRMRKGRTQRQSAALSNSKIYRLHVNKTTAAVRRGRA